MAENIYVPDIGGLKGKSTTFKPLPMQSQAIDVLRDLLSLHEEVEMSLDGLYVNENFFGASISHETHGIKAIPTDGAENKIIMKAADEMFQVCRKCGFKLHCDK